MKRSAWGMVMALAIAAMAVPYAHAATFVTPPDKNGSVAVTSPVNDDLFAAGNSAAVNASVGGEIFLAGNTVQVAEAGGRSVFAVGNSVTVSKGSGYDAFVAGNTVTLSGTYGHDVYVAGNSVTVTEGTVINGDLRAAGNTVTLAGTVKGSVFVGSADVTSSAVVGGDFTAQDSTLTFTGGSIGGNLSYQAPKDAAGLNTLTVGGTTHRSEPPKHVSAASVWFLALLLMIFSSFLLGALLIMAWPKRLQSISEELRDSWVLAFGRGMAVLILVPLASMVLIMVFIGFKAAAVLGMLYLAFLMLASIIAMISAAYLFLGKSASLWTALLVGSVVVSVLVALPVLGWLLGVLFFFGAVVPVFGMLATRFAADSK